MKKTFAMLLAIVMVMSLATVAFAADECEHLKTEAWGSGKPGYHEWICSECSESMGESECVFVDGICTICGANEPKAEEPKTECEHGKPLDLVCCECEGKHVYENGFCIYCSAEEPAKTECEHGKSLDLICCECEGKHVYEYGFCIYCSDEQTECEHGKSLDLVCCECEGKHVYEYGFCIFCSAEEPVAPECEHFASAWGTGKYGYHTWICDKCDADLGEAPCKFVDGVCEFCGATEVVDDTPVDDVPKTGDALTLIMSVMMSVGFIGTGASIVSLKRH